jgi:hypothetical protein
MSKASGRSKREAFNLKKMIVPGLVMLAFWTLATVLWQSTGEIMALFFFAYIGTSVGVGLGLHAALPKKKKPRGRRLALFLVGTFLIGFAAIQGQENMQVEGLFFGLLTGIFQAAVVHYLIAKIFGPILFGRLWCGWACWTVMVLDLLQSLPGARGLSAGRTRLPGGRRVKPIQSAGGRNAQRGRGAGKIGRIWHGRRGQAS